MLQPKTLFDRAWKRGARDFFLSLSLANLAYYPIWNELVNLPDAYFGKEPPPSIAFAAAWFSVLLLTLITTSARLLPAIVGSGRLRDSALWITPAVWLLPLSFFISSLSQQLGASSWLSSGAQVALILVALFTLHPMALARSPCGGNCRADLHSFRRGHSRAESLVALRRRPFGIARALSPCRDAAYAPHAGATRRLDCHG